MKVGDKVRVIKKCGGTDFVVNLNDIGTIIDIFKCDNDRMFPVQVKFSRRSEVFKFEELELIEETPEKPATSKFKVGDKVECYRNLGPAYFEQYVGKIGKIAEIQGSRITLDNDDLVSYNESELRLIPEKPAKPKIELTVKNTVFINGVEMRKFELIDLRNKIDAELSRMDS